MVAVWCWSSREDIPHIQGQEQQLHFAGAAVKRYPRSKVRSEEIPQVQGKRNPTKMVGAESGHQRVDRLKPQSQKTSESNHMDHSLV